MVPEPGDSGLLPVARLLQRLALPAPRAARVLVLAHLPRRLRCPHQEHRSKYPRCKCMPFPFLTPQCTQHMGKDRLFKAYIGGKLKLKF